MSTYCRRRKCANNWRLKNIKPRRLTTSPQSKNHSAIRRVALLGGGVIGAGWAARLLLCGIDVVVYDPDATIGARVNQVVDNAERAWRKMTLAPIARSGRLTFASDVAEAVRDAQFVQESGPERLDLKQQLLAEAGQYAPRDVVIASSTSGLLPSAMQSKVRYPERVLVGHPFNPVYLIPLVEIVGGAQTDDAARQTAEAFYRDIGMHPLQVRKEVDAFLADRLLEAVWRESLHLVNEGAATVDEIDRAICYGPGLRWSFMGSFLVYRIAGGEGGFRHFMAQFAPSLKWPWTRFDGPEMTEQLLDKLSAQSDAQADGASLAELETVRDDCLTAVMQGLRANDYAAGAVWNRFEEKLYENARHSGAGDSNSDSASTNANQSESVDADAALDIKQPLTLHRAIVPAEWLDYNRHVSESRYLQAFGDASDRLFRYLGVDRDYHAAGFSYYTAETHINFYDQAHAGEAFYITTQLLGGDAKRIHLYHTMYAAQKKLAGGEQLLLHVDTANQEKFARRNRG